MCTFRQGSSTPPDRVCPTDGCGSSCSSVTIACFRPDVDCAMREQCFSSRLSVYDSSSSPS